MLNHQRKIKFHLIMKYFYATLILWKDIEYVLIMTILANTIDKFQKLSGIEQY